VNEKRQKLSKRRDKVALEDYRDEGYLPEAVRNYLMLLGWAPSGNREILPWETLVEEFRLDNVTVSPAFFDVKKMRALNGDYIRALSPEEFITRSQPWLAPPIAPWSADAFDPELYAAVVPVLQTRIGVMSELVPNVDFLFLDEPVYDESSWTKAMTDTAGAVLDSAIATLQTTPWNPDAIRTAMETVASANDLKLGKAQAPVRVAVTGRTSGLPLFESLTILGRARTLTRLRAARAKR
jgi:glutamyl-tRNA synthetase